MGMTVVQKLPIEPRTFGSLPSGTAFIDISSYGYYVKLEEEPTLQLPFNAVEIVCGVIDTFLEDDVVYPLLDAEFYPYGNKE